MYYQIQLNQMQHQLAQQAPLSQGDLEDTLLNILTQMEDNAAANISELEKHNLRKS